MNLFLPFQALLEFKEIKNTGFGQKQVACPGFKRFFNICFPVNLAVYWGFFFKCWPEISVGYYEFNPFKTIKYKKLQ
ncbi:MAG: hypothetical protein F3745_06775 [Nitrospinae bacterium]|nr:hypothetical protein [Nitrospinota bacterium]